LKGGETLVSLIQPVCDTYWRRHCFKYNNKLGPNLFARLL